MTTPIRARAVPKARYPIRAVSKLTGLGIDTLRAWERRHGAVKPSRDDRGRLYSDRDVERLRLLREAVAGGHSIGQIARLDDAELRRLAGGRAEPRHVASEPAAEVGPPDLEGLLIAVRTFDRVRIEADLRRAATHLKPVELLDGLLVPLLTRVGRDWHAGLLSIAHEHFASEIVRSVVGSLLSASGQGNGARRLLFTTPPGELHELGILGAALLASAGGLGALYLGSDLPADNILSSASVAAVDVVVLGLGSSAAASSSVPTIVNLARHLPPHVELWVGGGAVAELVLGQIGTRPRLLSTFADFERELVRLGASL
jgi:DNA-binding transcriptional MerR regulator